MRIIIIGCGRMGAGLAHTLAQRGHAVTVVDNDPTAFERLGPPLTARRSPASASTGTFWFGPVSSAPMGSPR